MQLTSQQAEGLIRQGIEELQQGRPGEARRLFESVTSTGASNAQLWLLLATACRMGGDAEAEEEAVDKLLAAEPRVIRAHIMKGDCRARAGDETAALGFYTSAVLIADGERLPDDLLGEIRRIEGVSAEIKARLEAQREEALAARGMPAGERSLRFQESLDIMARRKRAYFQEPTGYFFPGLTPIQFFNPTDFDWVADVESATDAIREELLQLISEGTRDFRPYIVSDANRPRIDDNQLLDNADWSARFLCENGKLSDDTIASCPKTWEAVQAASLPWIANSPTVMFSLLRAGARINPHTGTHNTRLVCHLPLVVPPNCGFRVGNETREWEEGKLLIFDDTIEHEAWNDSNRDRVVLIFDIWRPELSEQERAEVGALFSGPLI